MSVFRNGLRGCHLLHFAFVCVPTIGHMNPMLVLAKELVGRGHSATFIHHPDLAFTIQDAGLAFHPIGEAHAPAGSLKPAIEKASAVHGVFGMRSLIKEFARETQMFCDELPDALRALSIDAIVGDWLEPAVGLVAHHLSMPYISVAAALPLNWEQGIPSPFVGWRHGETRWHRYRNIAAQYVVEAAQSPLHKVTGGYATRWNLGPIFRTADFASPFAQIAQLTPSLDYPRQSLIGCFHYCGPFRAAPHQDTRRPRRKTGRAFASLGSLMGHRADVFERIADATAAAGLELTIAHGGLLAPEAAARLARRATVHEFVSYDRIFKEVDVAILHGGMNGVLDALADDVPLVVVPLAFEQGAIASRVRHAGAGLVCRPHAMRWRLAGAIKTVIEDPSFAENAARVGADIRKAGGTQRAADIVERVARTRQPCVNAQAVSRDPALAPFTLDAA